MTKAQKWNHVRQWLFTKLLNDRYHKCMSPGPGPRSVKNQMKWEGFDITDAELDDIVNSMFSQYEAKQRIHWLKLLAQGIVLTALTQFFL